MIFTGYIAVVLIGYLLGSIPFGILVSRRSAKIDVRQIGSGKTGMTNVLRVAGEKAAVLVLLLDMGKGALAVGFAWLIFSGDFVTVKYSGIWSPEAGAQALAGLAAMVGHIWPIFIKFRGGRGVSTFFGGMAAIYLPVAVFGGLILFAVAGISRYMSLGSITGVVGASTLLILLILSQGVIEIPGVPEVHIEYLIYTMISAIFIMVTHRDNIKRLVSGKERKLGKKTKK